MWEEVRSNMKIRVLFDSQGWLACYFEEVQLFGIAYKPRFVLTQVTPWLTDKLFSFMLDFFFFPPV